MNTKLLATTLAALMAASALPALAQDAGAGETTTVETPLGDAGASASAGVGTTATTEAMGTADHSYASVIAALSASADTDLTAVTDQSTINIVLLSSLSGDAATEGGALDDALASDAEATASLHTAIAANAVILASLEAQGYSADDVVAVQSQADGAVTLYVDDRS